MPHPPPPCKAAKRPCRAPRPIASLCASDGGIVDDGHAGRMDVFAEYALTDVLGLTASLPLVWTDVAFDDIWGIGAIHLGGYGRLRFGEQHELVLRAGAQLPTESYPIDGTYSDDVVLRATAFQRLEDPMLSSGAVWLRGGASYRLRLGPVVGQVDYLVDVPFGGDLQATGELSPDGFWARVFFAGGVAYAPGPWAVAGELGATGFPYLDRHEDLCRAPEVLTAMSCEQLSTVATVSARWNGDPVIVSLWFSKALDEIHRIHDVHVIGLGARSSF